MNLRNAPLRWLFLLLVPPASSLFAQTAPVAVEAAPATHARPLPDIPTLMRQVEARERVSESAQKDYLYREQSRFDVMNSHDGIKKVEQREYEVFWLNGMRAARLVKKNGKDLTPDEKIKEDEQIEKVAQKAKERRAKADAQGKDTDSHGREEIGVSRILELGAFSNARREQIHGRDTIVVDYTGDPKAKTHNAGEGAFKELAGTVWIDEQDRLIQHVEGHFVNDFKVMGGLAVDVKKGTWFRADFSKINDEVWLPVTVEGDGHARYLLFFSINGHFNLRTSDYRKFKATSTVLPNFAAVDPASPEGSTQPLDPAKSPTEAPKL